LSVTISGIGKRKRWNKERITSRKDNYKKDIKALSEFGVRLIEEESNRLNSKIGEIETERDELKRELQVEKDNHKENMEQFKEMLRFIPRVIE